MQFDQIKNQQNLFCVWWNQQAARKYAAKHPKEQNIDNEHTWN